jgi:hypothetical protein
LDVQAGARLADALAALQRTWPDLGRPDQQPNAAAGSELTSRDDRTLLERMVGFCAQTTRLVAELRAAGGRLASALGAPLRERTLDQVQALAVVARDADAAIRPEPGWIDPGVQGRLGVLLDKLDEHTHAYQAQASELEAVFEWPAAEQLDLARLCDRYGHARIWEWLTPGWWRDRRQLKQVIRAGRITRTVTDLLYRAHRRQLQGWALDELEKANRQLLGRFHQPRATDTTAARAALQRLQDAATKLGDDYQPGGVAAQLAGDGPADPELAGCARQVLGTLATWSEQPRRLLAGHTDILTELTLPELGTWTATTATALRTCTETLDAVNQQRRRPTRLADALAELRLATAVDARRRRFEELPDAQRTLLGDRYQGLESAWSELVRMVGMAPVSGRAAR